MTYTHPEVAALPREAQETYREWMMFFARFAVFEADEAHEVALARAMAEGCGARVDAPPPMIIYGAR
jgi:hypothetical protein